MGDDYFLRNRETTAIATGSTQRLGLAIATRLERRADGTILSGRSVEELLNGERARQQLMAGLADLAVVGGLTDH